VPAGRLGAVGPLTDSAPLSPLVSPAGLPEPVTMPELPRFCRDVDDGGIRLCTDDEVGCPPGQMPDPKAPKTCLDIGTTWLCPPGFLPDPSKPVAEGALVACKPDPADCGPPPYGDVTPGPKVLYVDGTAKPGGDGSLTAPLRRISNALASASAGSTIAVAAGTYKESIVIYKPVMVRGRCAAMVQIEGTANPIVRVKGNPSENAAGLQGVTLRGAGGGIASLGQLKLLASRIFIDRPTTVGVVAAGATGWLHIEDSVITGTEHGAQYFGVGALAHAAGILELRRVRVTGSRMAGIVAAAGKLTARDVLVDGTRVAVKGGMTGQGARVEQGGSMTLVSSRFHGNLSVGVNVIGTGSWLEGRALVVDHTRRGPIDLGRGEGLLVELRAKASLAGVLLEHNRAAGLAITATGTEVEVNGLWVRGTLPDEVTKFGGFGVRVIDGGHAKLRGAWLHGNRSAGLHVEHSGTRVQATELLVGHTLPIQSTGHGGHAAHAGHAGHGVEVSNGARLTMERIRLHANRASGLLAAFVHTEVIGRDWQIDGTLPRQFDNAAGSGLSASKGASVRLVAGRLSGNRDAGLLSFDKDTRVAVAGVLIDGTLPRSLFIDMNTGKKYRPYGVGVAVFRAGSLQVQGLRLRSNRWLGIQASGAGATLRAVGCAVENTLAEPENGIYGIGLGAAAGVTKAHIRSCRVVGSHTAGAAVHNSALDIRGSVIVDTKASEFQGTGPDGTLKAGQYVELADGVLAKDAKKLTLQRTLVHGQLRAALLLDGGKNLSVSKCALSGGAFGMATQGGAEFDLTDSWIHGSQSNRAGLEELFVPPAPGVVGE